MIKINAVIFDMDGVISDTQSICSSAGSVLLSGYGIAIPPEEITKRYAGVSSREFFLDAFQRNGIDMPDMNVLLSEWRRTVNNETQGHVRAIPGTVEFMKRLKSRSIPIAVASGSHPSFIDSVLTELGVKQEFNAICSSHEVENGKPHPDVFLLAAQRLEVDPKYCLVVEDGISGMMAARRAGMRCIALAKAETDEIRSLVDITVEHLGDEKVLATFDLV